MNHDDFTRHGTDLLQRVQQQVDAPKRLRQLGGRQRNTRVAFAAVAAAVVLFVALLGGLWWLSDDIAPADQPGTTTTLRALPVEASIVLLSQFTVDEATGTCSGEGDFTIFVAASEVRFVDELSLNIVETFQLPEGSVIGAAEVARLGGSPVSSDACRFSLSTGFAIDDFDGRILDAGFDPDPGSDVNIGQRITFFYGGEQ